MASHEKNESFMLRLKKEVWPLHEITEKQSPLAPVAAGEAEQIQYQEALARFYGFIEPFETGIEQYILSSPERSRLAPAYHGSAWKRADLLRTDLRNLGMKEADITDLPSCTGLPPITSFAHLLGHLYLLEGSRLGGQVLAAITRERLNITETDGAAYFSSNGQDVHLIWKRFKHMTETYAKAKGGENIISAAKACFQAMLTWFSFPNQIDR